MERGARGSECGYKEWECGARGLMVVWIQRMRNMRCFWNQ